MTSARASGWTDCPAASARVALTGIAYLAIRRLAMKDITMAHNPKFIRRRLGTTVLVVVAVLVAAILLAGVIALLG
ncbi:hypothetical protein ACIBF7_33700 [Nonomuraea sp. NPDC050478]|uniref:hypothetical protein n=1 Tax=Nonomuraea sp. NPDC050478 TaxID=3364365 RepID=UPI0037A573FB